MHAGGGSGRRTGAVLEPGEICGQVMVPVDVVVVAAAAAAAAVGGEFGRAKKA